MILGKSLAVGRLRSNLREPNERDLVQKKGNMSNVSTDQARTRGSEWPDLYVMLCTGERAGFSMLVQSSHIDSERKSGSKVSI